MEFYIPTSYSTVVEALIGKWMDVAVLVPYSYVIANSKGSVRLPSIPLSGDQAKNWNLYNLS